MRSLLIGLAWSIGLGVLAAPAQGLTSGAAAAAERQTGTKHHAVKQKQKPAKASAGKSRTRKAARGDVRVKREAGEPVLEQKGKASFYSDRFHGRKTAAGDRYDRNRMTGASNVMPLGSKVTVTNEENGRSVDLKINDRGPHAPGRVIDVSREAAERLDMKDDGVAPVTVEAKPSAQPTADLRQKVDETAQNAAERQRPRTADSR